MGKAAKVAIRCNESVQQPWWQWLKWSAFKPSCRPIWRKWWAPVIRVSRRRQSRKVRKFRGSLLSCTILTMFDSLKIFILVLRMSPIDKQMVGFCGTGVSGPRWKGAGLRDGLRRTAAQSSVPGGRRGSLHRATFPADHNGQCPICHYMTIFLIWSICRYMPLKL